MNIKKVFDFKCQVPRRELYFRFLGILLISLFFSLVYTNFPISSTKFFFLFLNNFTFTGLTWHGCMYISIFLMKNVDIFKHPVKHLIILFFSLVSYTLLIMVIDMNILIHFFYGYISKELQVAVYLISVLITLFITTFYSSFFFFHQWRENLNKAERLEKSNLEARYETLKSQVNPHFLFNSLNTLLTMVQENPAASKYVESLSEFMRYVLQTREKEAVLLRDELQMARQYLFIQQTRFGEKLEINIDIPESFYHYAIPPLALQMLLENAIKHNEISRQNHLIISVYISNQRKLVVENNLQKKNDSQPSTGIGLLNIGNRYKYLSGNDIEIIEEKDKFRVALPLLEVPL